MTEEEELEAALKASMEGRTGSTFTIRDPEEEMRKKRAEERSSVDTSKGKKAVESQEPQIKKKKMTPEGPPPIPRVPRKEGEGSSRIPEPQETVTPPRPLRGPESIPARTRLDGFELIITDL